ncbi:hypothetical protein [Pseudomonas sp. R1-15]|uniref:hypothetical protein n=1 Tax=Pseudomonas sp. R1-15 TaxID=2817399 RepID=UPI003DA863F7
MHHRIHAAYHQAAFSRSTCAWLTIDDVAIEQWLASHLNDASVALLGLSLMWLMDEEEDALARRRFIPGEDGSSTLVPLLVCSDDMDFDCTVLMVEQVSTATPCIGGVSAGALPASWKWVFLLAGTRKTSR